MKKKPLIFTIIIVGIFMIMLLHKNNKDLYEYTERVLGIEWKNCIEEITGEVETKGGEYAYLCLEIKEGREEEVISILQSICGQSLDSSSFTIPGYQGHDFATELENSNIQFIFEYSVTGKKAKTRNVMLYVTMSEGNRMYVYMLG